MTLQPILARAVVKAVIAALPDHARATLMADDNSIRLATEDGIVDQIMAELEECYSNRNSTYL
tara:strand:- start:12370 stop:12558 length:189 start_codon:yes stop_codon:yes gene_type:complete